MSDSIYLDNHATTQMDPDVLEAMLPWMTDRFGNPGSVSHDFGRQAREAVEQARVKIAHHLGFQPARARVYQRRDGKQQPCDSRLR